MFFGVLCGLLPKTFRPSLAPGLSHSKQRRPSIRRQHHSQEWEKLRRNVAIGLNTAVTLRSGENHRRLLVVCWLPRVESWRQPHSPPARSATLNRCFAALNTQHSTPSPASAVIEQLHGELLAQLPGVCRACPGMHEIQHGEDRPDLLKLSMLAYRAIRDGWNIWQTRGTAYLV